MSSYKAINNTERLGAEHDNLASVLRYPFRSMELGWLDSYLRGVPAAERATVLLRVMDILMAHTILHEDPFMEEAVTFLHRRIPEKSLPEVSPELVDSFEVTHHVFKTICWTAKFPTSPEEERRGVLKITDTRTAYVCKVVQSKNSPAISAAVPIAAGVALEHVRLLREDLNSRTAFTDLMSSLKTLFFTLSTRSGVPLQGRRPPFSTFVCCTGCSCYAQLRNGYTVFLHQLERAKIIDCAMIAAVNTDDDFMHDVVAELIGSGGRDYMDAPQQDIISRFVHNGRLFYCRMALFDALNLLQFMGKRPDAAAARAKGEEDGYCTLPERVLYLDRYCLMLTWVRDEVAPLRALCELVPHANRTLMTAEGLYPRLMESDCLEDLSTLREYTAALFSAISAPEYHLAVHSRDGFVGKPATMRCACAQCPGKITDLLKCSGCDVTYYCSAQCQKADWERHKHFCHDMESRRGKPVAVESKMTAFKTLKTAV